MSPSEFDLRAALHDGEGDPVDASAIISAGRARAARRRNQVRTGLATLAVVGGLVGVGVVLNAADNNTSSGGGKAYTQNSAAGGDAKAPVVSSSTAGAAPSVAERRDSGSGSSAKAAEPAASRPPVRCPATAPALPGAGAAGSSTARMFARPVSDVLVCSYPPGATTGAVRSVTITGAQARQFAASLETADTQRATSACPAYIRADQRTIRVLARSTDKTPLAPVVAVLNAPPCRVLASNGTAVRYGWTPPAALGPVLRQLVAAPPAAPKQGSPARS